MNIYLTKGSASASTKLSAFDKALFNAGIANFNLISLSSVIPVESNIIEIEPKNLRTEGEWGDRLYVVMADYRTSVHGEDAWAGIGWVQDPVTAKGLFVEFEGTSEGYVRESIESSLNDLMRTRNIDFGEIHMAINGITCKGDPVCALVAAVYKSESWN